MPENRPPFAPSRRLAGLPTYALARVFAARDAAVHAGLDVIDLGVGNPDMRPAPHVIEALHRALDDTAQDNHRYPTFDGLPEFRAAIAAWYGRRFAVTLDPATEVLPLIGSKEGIAHFLLAHLDPGDTVLLQSPCYPAYLGAGGLFELDVVEVETDPVTGRLALERIPSAACARARMLLLNYPNNPTGATETAALYDEILAFAREHDLGIVSDIAYCDLPMDPAYEARSFLQHDRAHERTLEFHSFSKTHSMPGWRVAHAAGNATAIAQLRAVKTNCDFSVFAAIQRAAIAALESPPEVLETLVATYRRRQAVFCEAIESLGWTVPRPRAGMYVWMPIPRGYGTCEAFAADLVRASGIVVAPGTGFGAFGEGFVRVSLTVPEARLREAGRRLAAAGISADSGPAAQGGRA